MKSTPLVSCIMPTYNRRRFVSQSIWYFLRQDYPARELVIVDDGSDAVADLVPDDKRMRYVRLDKRYSVGAKRNLACEVSQGELIAHWDDDDWYASNRLSLQVSELLSSEKDLCGTSDLLFYHVMAGQAWRYRYPSNRRPWLVGSTLLYRRSAWAAHPFPDQDVGEDTAFVWQFAPNRLHRIADSSFAVAIIHQNNTTSKSFKGPRWQKYPLSKVTELLAAERDFYVALRNGHAVPSPNLKAYFLFHKQGVKPLVSCILATKDRRAFFRQAVKYFQRQSYPNKELIVVDSSQESVEDVVPDDERISYLRVEPGTSLGRKLNLGISQSQGEIIQKLDDDDYYHPEFLSATVNTLIGYNPDRTIVGLNSILVLIAATGELKKPIGNTHWCAGGTLCFFKKLWAKRPFRDLSLGEDYFFLKDHAPQLVKIDNPELYMFVRHENGHTWTSMEKGKVNVTEYFRQQPNYAKSLKEYLSFEEDGAFYQSLNQNCSEALQLAVGGGTQIES